MPRKYVSYFRQFHKLQFFVVSLFTSEHVFVYNGTKHTKTINKIYILSIIPTNKNKHLPNNINNQIHQNYMRNRYYTLIIKKKPF